MTLAKPVAPGGKNTGDSRGRHASGRVFAARPRVSQNARLPQRSVPVKLLFTVANATGRKPQITQTGGD